MPGQQSSVKRFKYRLGWLCLCWLVFSRGAMAQNWPQWGGPQRNFMADAKGLAETWPAGGPKRLWSRALGEGHSSIIADGDRLYTMYSKGDYADGKLILLDEDGQLALVRLSPQGMNVMAKASVLDHIAWTPPTLVGANLYLRDRRTIVALDLR